jgi:hypothetical protein
MLTSFWWRLVPRCSWFLEVLGRWRLAQGPRLKNIILPLQEVLFIIEHKINVDVH